MTDREFTEIEGQKEGRETEQAESAKEARELEGATTTPQSHVEAKIDYKESEGVETAFTDLVGTDKQVEPTEPPGTSGEEINKTRKKDGKDEATPINLPGPEAVVGNAEELTESKGIKEWIADEEQEKTPELKEGISDDIGKQDATPIPLPGKASPQDATPIPLPTHESQPTEEVPSGPNSEAEAIPINLPHPRPDAAVEETPGDPRAEAEAIPINLPYPRPEEVVQETTEASGTASGEEVVAAAESDKAAPGKSSGEELSQGDAASLPPQRLDVELPEEQLQGMQKEADILQDATTGGFKMPGVDGLPEGGDPGSVKIGEMELEDFNLAIEDYIKRIGALQTGLEKEGWTPDHIGGGPGPINPKFGGGYASEGPPSGKGSNKGDSNEETFVEIKNKKRTYEDLSPEEKKEYDKLYEIVSKVFSEAYHMKYKVRAEQGIDSMQYKLFSEEIDKIFKEVEESKERLDFVFGIYMPRPDGGEEDDTSNLTPDDVKFENQAVDPAVTQGGPQSSGLNEHKMQGIVSDPAEWQEDDTPDSGVKYDTSQVTDPSGDELSKGGAEAASKD